jgi:hypothetical protein
MAYLPKPLDFDELLSHVQKGVERYRAYRAVRRARERVQSWHRELEQIQPALSATPGETPVEAFRALMFRHFAGCLADLNNLTQAPATEQSGQPEACQLFNCSRFNTLNAALLETIEVLEKTQNAFESNELDELRKKLETIVVTGVPVKN